ncbi:MAG: type II toxin-antitoxin system RelE family toxin [Promethearchaeota archaeon]
MKYEVKWTDTSLRELEKLTKKQAKRIIDKVESVASDPFRFVKKLRGFDLYRLRIGDYRVIMSIERCKLVIFVLDVGHRKVIYRKY